jgi:hypothetical protein
MTHRVREKNMISKPQITAVLLSWLIASGSGWAGTRTGPLGSVGALTGSNGRELLDIVHASTSTEVPNVPCNTSGEFVFDLATEKGREAANLARLAFALGANFTVVGTGNCTLSPGREDGDIAQTSY